MYLATLSKHPYVNSNQLVIIVYKIHYLIQSRSMTYASLSKSTMSHLVDPMTRDNLDTNMIGILLSWPHHDFLHAMLCFMDFINPIEDLNQFNVRISN